MTRPVKTLQSKQMEPRMNRRIFVHRVDVCVFRVKLWQKGSKSSDTQRKVMAESNQSEMLTGSGRDDAIPAQKWSSDAAQGRVNSLSVADRASFFERPRTITTSNSSPRADTGSTATSGQSITPTTTTQPSWFSFLGGNNKATMEYCASPNCRRAVYKAERMFVAAGIVYHRPCFLCGGGTTNGCKRLLTLDAYEVLQGLPFCVHCCRKIQSGAMALHK